MLACGGAAAPAWGQAGGGTGAPGVALDATRVGDLRATLDSLRPNAPPRSIGPNWQVNGGLGVDVGVTDNALRVNSPRRADVFTLITPSIAVSADTAHIQANASYAPSISIYANNGRQSQVSQSGQAGALITFVPDTLFLDLRGSISESSLAGGFGTSDGRGYNGDGTVTSISLSATPYAQHRFGGWGTGLISYSIAQTLQDTPSGNVLFATNPNANPGLNGAFGNQPFYGSTGDLTTQRERASFTTGENFGRINNLSVVSATQYNGSGTYRGAYRNEVSTTTGYAVTRTVTVLGTIGYQDLHYGGIPPFNVNQGLWSVGGRYAPNPNLTATLTYGRRDGITDFAADASWFPTARTALFVRYSTGLTSDSEEFQNVLATTNVGPNGLLTDRVTGAPVSGGSGFFGTQNGVFELRRASLTGLLTLNRDSFSATISNERRTSVSGALSNTGTTLVPAGTSTTGTFGTVSWGHQLSDRLSSSVSASYGVNDNGAALGLGSGSGSQTSFSGQAALSYIFTPTLTGRVVYSHTSVSGGATNAVGANAFSSFNGFGNGFGGQSGNYDENALLAGLRKSF